MSRPLFDALEEVGERIGRAPHLLLCLDFDGTLTPIVDDPASVYLSPSMQRVLRALAAHENASVAFISGRRRADLEARIGLAGLIYAGNHGLEINGPHCQFIEPTAVANSGALGELAACLIGKLQPIEGALVEDKGLTLSVHYRRVSAEQGEEVRRIIHTLLANTNYPFHLTLGDMVYEIRPRVYWDKGTAAVWIREQLGHPDALAICLGNDITDEDAFAALRDDITVKIGDPSETLAHYQLDGPAEVQTFLEWLDSLLGRLRLSAHPR